MLCWKCGKKIELSVISRFSECEFCGADLHCCKGCKFYTPNSHFDCKENIFEPVSEKEKSNFCDYFSVLDTSMLSKDTNQNIKAFSKLFGEENISTFSETKNPKDKFNALFED